MVYYPEQCQQSKEMFYKKYCSLPGSIGAFAGEWSEHYEHPDWVIYQQRLDDESIAKPFLQSRFQWSFLHLIFFIRFLCIQRRDNNPGNVQLIHLFDGKHPLVKRYLIPFLRHFIQLGEKPTADGVIIRILDRDVEMFIDILDQQAGIDQCVFSDFLDQRQFVVKFILDFP